MMITLSPLDADSDMILALDCRGLAFAMFHVDALLLDEPEAYHRLRDGEQVEFVVTLRRTVEVT